MPWARFEAAFPRHPKVIQLTDVAFRMHVEAICWSVEHLTDGVIPGAVLSMFAHDPKQQRLAPARGIAAELSLAGLWENTGEDYRIHDFAKYQPTKAQVERSRADATDRQRRSRSRRDNAVTTSSLSQSPIPSPPMPEEPPSPRRGSSDLDKLPIYTRTQVRDVACPACGARPLQPCLGPGYEREANHAERVRAYHERQLEIVAGGREGRRRAGAENLGRTRAYLTDLEDEVRAELESHYGAEPGLVEAGLAAWREARGEEVPA